MVQNTREGRRSFYSGARWDYVKVTVGQWAKRETLCSIDISIRLLSVNLNDRAQVVDGL
jgi:hypothetical protein